MTTSTSSGHAYRDDLAAAHSRSSALEEELARAHRLIDELQSERGSGRGRLGKLMAVGASMRAREYARREREQQRVARAARREQKRRARSDARAEARRRRRSVTRLGRFAHCLWPLSTAPIAVMLLPLFIMSATARGILFYFVAGVILMNAFARVLGRLGVRWEEHRQRAMPFAVLGHLGALGHRLDDPSIEIQFADAPPSEEEFQTLLYGLSAGWFSSIGSTRVRKKDARTLELVLKGIETSFLSANRGYLKWYRTVVEKAALEVHAVCPIEEVRVRARAD